MNLQQLQYFLEAARTLNFTRTAENFYISQSAVTQQIKNLEAELQVDLFQRVNRKLYLTDAGKMFVEEAYSLIEHTQNAIEKVQSVQKGFIGQLNIGYMQSMEMNRFPKTIQDFHMKYPGVKLNLKRDNAKNLYEDYQNQKYDVIFNLERDYFVYHNTIDRRLNDFGFSVALPPNHRLALHKKIHQSELVNESLIMHDCNRNDWEQKNTLSWKILNEDLYGNVVTIEKDTETALILVAAGVGIAILPDFDISMHKMNLNISYVPLDTGGEKASIHLYYHKENTNPLLPLFLNECVEIL